MRDWHDISGDPVMWLSDQGALWLFLPCHFRGHFIPAATVRAVQVEPARAVARRLGELSIATPGALIQRIRELGPQLPLPGLCQPMSPDAMRAIFDDITRRGNPIHANAADVLGAAPDTGLLFPNLIEVLINVALPPARAELEAVSRRQRNARSAC